MLTQVGKYQIVEKIGIGGFGSVYKGRDPFIKRLVAIKTCQSDEEEIKKRFFREAEYAGNLHHRNITTIYDFGVTEEGVPYIVQEFLTGEDLDKKIKRKDPLTPVQKLRVMMDVCEGLGYAHTAGIIHRDIKPSNIRIIDDGTVKIMDFGIAKSLVSESTLTQTGITLGTASYLAPEQIRGEAVDPRTDIFSLGVLGYELLTGSKPFTGDHISTVLYKILNEAPPSPSTIDPRVPLTASLAVMRALEKDRDRRPYSCHELRELLAASVMELGEEVSMMTRIGAGAGSQATLPMPPVVVNTPSEGAEEAVSTPSGGIGRTAATKLSTPLPASPREPSAARPSMSAVEAANLSPSARVSDRTGIGDVRIRPEGAPPSDVITPPSEQASSGPLKMVVGAALVLALGGGAAYMVLQGRAQTPDKTPPIPAEFTPPPEPSIEVPTLPIPSPMPTAAPTARPTSNPTVLPSPTGPAAQTPPPVGPTGFAVLSANHYSTVTIDRQRKVEVLAAVKVSLKPGPHTAVFETKGLPAVVQNFEVRAGQTVDVRADFPGRGQLSVQVNYEARDAEIFLDGTALGKAPIKRLVSSGQHRIEAVLPGYKPYSKTISIAEEDSLLWRIVMERDPNASAAPAPAPAADPTSPPGTP